MNLPESYEFDIGAGDVLWGIFQHHVSWTEINYVNAVWNIIGIKVEFVSSDDGLGQKIHLDFPLMK